MIRIRSASTCSVRCMSALVVSMVAGHAAAATINVPADQPTIQAAVNVAVTGDEIVVADGVYSGFGFIDIDLQGKDLVIRSANGPASTTLNGSFQGRAFLINSGQTSATVIEGFTFDSHGDFFTDEGGAILVQGAGATIRNSVFRNGSALDGGAIAAINGAEVTIEGCRFGAPDFADSGGAIYIADSSVTIDDSEFKDIDLDLISGGGSGGAIFMSGGSLTVTNSNFENLTAGQGGALRAIGSSTNIVETSFTNCTFRNNTTSSIGGALRFLNADATLVDCVFENNTAGNQGGAIYGGGLFMDVVENVQFINNRAIDPVGGGNTLGGAVRFAAQGARLSFGNFVDCLFEGNTASNSGTGGGQSRGAAVYQFSGDSTFTNCVFRNNENRGATTGVSTHGSVVVLGIANVTFTDCLFEGNVARIADDNNATAWGAAISCFSSTGEVTIDGCEFINNDGQQGAVYLQSSAGSNRPVHVVTNSLFEGNTTNFGALRIVTNTESTVTNTIFRNNTSTSARAALAIQNQDTICVVENCVFENNSSDGNGGAIGIFNPLEVTIRNSVFDGNTSAGSSGGAIRIDNTDSVPHATSILIEGSEFRNNEASFGASISAPVFSGSNNITLTVRDSLFENNSGAWGPGIHTQGFLTDGIAPSVVPVVVVESSTFRNNNASSGGAAIRFNTAADATVVGSLIEDNTTNGSGGGIWAQGVSGVGIRDTIIRNNNAVLNGGGVFHTEIADVSSTLNIANSLIAGNATEIGGGLYAEGDTTTNLLNVTVAENTAEILANSINADTGAEVRLDNSIVWSASGVAFEQIAAGFDAEVTANWSNIQGGEAGVSGAGTTNWLAGNIDADPQFADTANDDYTLGEGSASVDAGDSSLVSGIDF
ncbi:MAG: hypothetical protein EA423_02965, partial [Phycisphaerales bacterium]